MHRARSGGCCLASCSTCRYSELAIGVGIGALSANVAEERAAVAFKDQFGKMELIQQVMP
jgi:hypothetical protein